MDPEVRRFFNEMGKDLKALSKPFTLERLKVLSNFTIAGAILFTALTIKDKTFAPSVRLLPASSSPAPSREPLEVVITDIKSGLGEVDVNLKKGPVGGFRINSLGDLGVRVNGSVNIQDNTIRPYKPRF